MRKNIKYNIFAGVLLLVILYFGISNLQKEGFIANWNSPSKDKITFLTAHETAKFIMLDPDNYMHHLNLWDLIARQVSLEIDYRRRSAAASIDFSDDQKSRLAKAACKADAFFASYRGDPNQTNDYVTVSGKTIAEIPWVFALTDGKAYEDGMPHTRANIIFLSTEIDETPKNLFKLLIHEKVHLYQRLYPNQTNAYLANNGFIQWKLRQGIPRMRSNPDLNPWVYIENSSSKPLMALYSSDKPKNISDVITAYNNITYEHPYELMAYTIEKQALATI